MQKCQSGPLPIFGFLLRQRFLGSCRNSECSVATGVGPSRAFWVVTRNSGRQSFLALCHDTILYVATWSTGCRWLLGRDRVRCRDRVWPGWGRNSVAIGDFRVTTELAKTGEDSEHGRRPARATVLTVGTQHAQPVPNAQDSSHGQCPARVTARMAGAQRARPRARQATQGTL